MLEHIIELDDLQSGWAHEHVSALEEHLIQAGVGELWVYSRPQVDRIWGTWGSYYNMPKAIFYLLKGDYRGSVFGVRVEG